MKSIALLVTDDSQRGVVAVNQHAQDVRFYEELAFVT